MPHFTKRFHLEKWEKAKNRYNILLINHLLLNPVGTQFYYVMPPTA